MGWRTDSYFEAKLPDGSTDYCVNKGAKRKYRFAVIAFGIKATRFGLDLDDPFRWFVRSWHEDADKASRNAKKILALDHIKHTAIVPVEARGERRVRTRRKWKKGRYL